MITRRLLILDEDSFLELGSGAHERDELVPATGPRDFGALFIQTINPRPHGATDAFFARIQLR